MGPGIGVTGTRLLARLQKPAQALASDVSTAIIAITKASMTMTLPTMTRQLSGPDMRLIAR